MLEKLNSNQIDRCAIVQCPKNGFGHVAAARHCPGCEYFDGLAVMTAARPGVNWSDCYAIRCTHPIERRTVYIDLDKVKR